MGFEILPIEDGDEEIFEIFTITTPVRWTPQRFAQDSFDTGWPITYPRFLFFEFFLNMSYYEDKHDHSKSSHIDKLDISGCTLMCSHLNDHTYPHNTTCLKKLEK